ncbi:MAG: (2Fe-2S)-binding protein [Ignavibacteriales bacterium]|nr:(2Fe-2S)-binding protein [Ignavibacteriales bacterium]
MSTNGSVIRIIIDGKEYLSRSGVYLIDVARENRIFIPTLCNISGVKPRGACRMCTVSVNGRYMTACTTPVSEGMEIKTNTPDLHDLRKAILEIMFVEGNHICPVCEKSGNCDLQALAYRFQILVPRFPYSFPKRTIDAENPLLVKDHNRCILCKRCIRTIKDEQGRSFFAFRKRGHKLEISIAHHLKDHLNKEIAQRAVDVCPTGALLKKESGYNIPISERKYERTPIGSEIESLKQSVIGDQ